jgi:ribokinase
MKKIINFGSLNIDHVYQVPHFVKPGETLAGTNYKCYCGGKGGNQSVALARAGLKVYHAGCIGKDGKNLRDNLAENAVNTDYVKTVEQASGHAIIQVNKQGENAIILYPGANSSITLEMIDDIFSEVSPGDILLLQNEINNIPAIMKKAVEKGLDIVFNFAPFSPEIAEKLPLHLLKILIINELEGAGLSGQNTTDGIIKTLSMCYPATIIVMTLGKEGVICIANGEITKRSSPDVKVIDTTCAGDTFIGFFLEAYLQNKSIKECLETGCAAGAIAVSRLGAADSIPFKHELGILC